MDYNTHVFWYYIHLCGWFPKDSPERISAFAKAHCELIPHLNVDEDEEHKLFGYLIGQEEAA